MALWVTYYRIALVSKEAYRSTESRGRTKSVGCSYIFYLARLPVPELVLSFIRWASPLFCAGSHQKLPQPVTANARQVFVGGTEMAFGWGCRQGNLRVVVLLTLPWYEVGPVVKEGKKEQYRQDEVDDGDDASVIL